MQFCKTMINPLTFLVYHLLLQAVDFFVTFYEIHKRFWRHVVCVSEPVEVCETGGGDVLLDQSHNTVQTSLHFRSTDQGKIFQEEF